MLFFYGVAILICSFSPSHHSSIGVSGLSPMVGFKYLHLSQSVAVRASHSTAMLFLLLHREYIHGSVYRDSIYLDAYSLITKHMAPTLQQPH